MSNPLQQTIATLAKEKGISLGCPLSPLMAALYLKPLDDALAKLNVFYTRFMDDWVVLAPSRWKLRKAIRITNQTLHELNRLTRFMSCH